MSQIGNLPQIGVKMKKHLSCHHLELFLVSTLSTALHASSFLRYMGLTLPKSILATDGGGLNVGDHLVSPEENG